MKRLWIYTAICFVLVLGSMFLPYTLHDATGDKDIQTAGLENDMALLLLPVLIVISLIVLIKKNLATGIIGFILGFFLIPYMWLLGFVLTFSLNWGDNSPYNYRFHIGFYLVSFAIASYWFLLLINMIVLARDRKTTRNEIEKLDLLDDAL